MKSLYNKANLTFSYENSGNFWLIDCENGFKMGFLRSILT